MKILRAIGRFLWDFIIGDDWKIAASVVCALFVAAVLHLAGVADAWVAVVGALALGVAFSVALIIDVRRSSRHDASPTRVVSGPP